MCYLIIRSQFAGDLINDVSSITESKLAVKNK